MTTSAGQLDLVNRKLIKAHEREREGVARELHDDLGQRLAVTTMDLDLLAKALPASAAEASSRIRALSDRTLALARDIQALSRRLHPSKLDYLGVVAASAAFCRDVAQRQNVDVTFIHEGVPDGLPKDLALSVFRVLQEAVTNAVEHAGVCRVEAALRGSRDEIRLEVQDAGIGFDVDEALTGRGLGLVGMRERVRLAGGELLIESRPGAGTSLRARIPLSSSGPASAAN